MQTITADWEAAKQALPIGTRQRARVTQHRPFGIFVDIPNFQFQGLVQITEFKDEGKMTVAEYPPIERVVEAVVLGFKEFGSQIWLGMKPSQLCRCQTPGNSD
jgi:ribosomal protein S1